MKKTVISIAALALVFFWSCAPKTGVDKALKTGDLIFVGIPAYYNLEPDSAETAIISATREENKLNIIHVAIAEVQGDSTWIIDATIKRGVDRYPLDTFLTDFILRDGSYPAFKVMRLKDGSKAEEFVENAKKYLGQVYDHYFLPDNGAMYCSELVRESYIEADGSYIFSEEPMNFKDADGNMPVYWEQLFARLGTEVPQGVRGTNPRSMMEEEALVETEVEL